MTGVPRNQILVGDALGILHSLPSGHIDTIVTSPPYFRLRNYGHEDQLGLETHVDEWVANLRAVLRECARVLVSTGTVWLNLGDTYSSDPRQGAAIKSLLLAPERLALGLLEDGWRIRNKIVWAKPNPIPSNARDRLSTTHEYIYVLSRQRRYYFDLDSIRVPHRTRRRAARPGQPPRSRRPDWAGPNGDGYGGLAALHAAGLPGHPLGKNPGDVWRVATSRFRGAHFATYPEELAHRMVLAGCPERVCRDCRSPWTRPVRRLGATATRLALRAGCDCAAETEPGLVLDPFFGAGTTALAAERLHRDWLGIELNPTFAALARERIEASRAGGERE